MGYDDRNYTMISYENWEDYKAHNYKYVEIFDTSNCYGDAAGPNKTSFSESLTNRMIKKVIKKYVYYEIKGQNILKR